MKRFLFALFLPFFVFGSVAVAQHNHSVEDLPLDDPAVPATTRPAESAAGVEDLPLDDPSVPSASPQKVPQTSSAASKSSAISPDAASSTHTNSDDSDTTDFLRQALYAGVIVAALCSYLGLFVLTRRMVFIGVALSEMSSAGIALGLLLGFSPLWGALGFMLLGVALFSRRWAPRLLSNDAVIGTFYVMAIALGILLVAKSPQGETHMLTLLQGDVLTVYPSETVQMALVFVGIAAFHLLFAKEFLLVSLDRDMAATLGFAAARWDFLLFLTIGIAVSLSIRSVGVLMTTAMLIVPAATALLVAPRWNRAALLAPVLGITAVALGLWLSLRGDFPASAVIVAILFVYFLPALLWHSMRRS